MRHVLTLLVCMFATNVGTQAAIVPCDASCLLHGKTYTCRQRIDWLQGRDTALSDALETVNKECSTQCSCSANDFAASPSPITCALFSQWPSIDNDVTCGGCTALVETAPYGSKCDTYCNSFGHTCVSAAEEWSDTCKVRRHASCSEEIKGLGGGTFKTSDMLCTCKASTGSTSAPTTVAPTTRAPTRTCNTNCALEGKTYTCRQRIDWLRGRKTVLTDALEIVNKECDSQCSCNLDDFPPILKVMSYNTEFVGYPGRVPAYGAKIREVDAAIVGVQECQDKRALARASGYEHAGTTSNHIFYNPAKVELIEGSVGKMSIPRDNYARRYITFARFTFRNIDFWHFNTHLPHRHNEASDPNTHARIARMLLEKRQELGADNMPTVVTGDFNPFASNGASEGSFESNLVAGGFKRAYKARGNPGFVGLDKIFVSHHWAFSGGADHGTGSSDHPAIAVDLMLIRDAHLSSIVNGTVDSISSKSLRGATGEAPVIGIVDAVTGSAAPGASMLPMQVASLVFSNMLYLYFASPWL